MNDTASTTSYSSQALFAAPRLRNAELEPVVPEAPTDSCGIHPVKRLSDAIGQDRPSITLALQRQLAILTEGGESESDTEDGRGKGMRQAHDREAVGRIFVTRSSCIAD